MNKILTWNEKGYLINGEPSPYISGELHYFRVPHKDWKYRLEMLKKSGANAVATYIPWIVHEQNEGEICFGDCPQRDLAGFLQLCEELDMMVVVRPGPYVGSELIYAGLPVWLMEKYPEIHALDFDGNSMGYASYLHPTFLEKAKKYISNAMEVIRPFLVTNGGPIVSVQIDNELGGIHLWTSGMDYNPEAMGIGDENGYFPKFLCKKYGRIENLNKAYGTNYTEFKDVNPMKNRISDDTVEGKRVYTDCYDYYYKSLNIYGEIVAKWFVDGGVDVPLCTNSGSGNETPMLVDLCKSIATKEKPFLLATDHYYTLNPDWGNDPTPQWILNWWLSLDQLRELDMPPSIFELQGGTYSDFPPMLPEHLSAMYMTHIALGMKGCNYYIFTGGKNFENTGDTCDVYDYHAAIGPNNEIRPHYYSQMQANEFALENSWLQNIDRSSDIQIGFTWHQRAFAKYCNRYSKGGFDLGAWNKDLLFTLLTSSYQPRFKAIDNNAFDLNKPLIIPSDDRMSVENQQIIVDYIKRGGKVVFAPLVPEFDEDFNPCTIIKDLIGMGKVTKINGKNKILLEDGTKGYFIQNQFTCDKFDGEVLATCESGEPISFYKKIGDGAVVWLGANWRYAFYSHNKVLEAVCNKLGTTPIVSNDCSSIFTTVYEDGNEAVCFVINLLSGRQTAHIKVKANGKEYDLGNVEVPPMTVLPIKI